VAQEQRHGVLIGGHSTRMERRRRRRKRRREGEEEG
jgi:hypothetical protein